MRFLTPLILCATFLISSGTASAQAPGMNRCAAEPASSCPAVARLRAGDSRLAAIVTEASVRSRSFRQLAQAIDQTDGIVYVEHGRCGHGVRACLAAVSAAGANRIVRDTRKCERCRLEPDGIDRSRVAARHRSAQQFEGNQYESVVFLL